MKNFKTQKEVKDFLKGKELKTMNELAHFINPSNKMFDHESYQRLDGRYLNEKSQLLWQEWEDEKKGLDLNKLERKVDDALERDFTDNN